MRCENTIPHPTPHLRYRLGSSMDSILYSARRVHHSLALVSYNVPGTLLYLVPHRPKMQGTFGSKYE